MRLADIANLREGAAPRFGDALVQGEPGILLTISSQYGSNTLAVTQGLERALAELAPVFERLGITLDTMTLGGLAIAIGEVVDDAIIDVENIAGRLPENERLAAPRPAHAVVLDASVEVRGAVVYATLIVGLVFIPLLSLSGVAGRFFAPLGQAYLLAVLLSLIVALVVTPALCLLLLRGATIESHDPPLQLWIKRPFARLLARTTRHARALVAATAALAIGAFCVLPFLGGDFLPAFREGHLVVHVAEAPGASLAELLRVGRAISADLLAIPGITTVSQQVGRAEQGEHTWGPHLSELHVELDRDSPSDENALTDRVRGVLASHPGIQFEVLTFLGDRVVPILMTALATGLGLLPLALGSGDAGREIEGPMAIVILGGLASSTLLNLLVLPVLAERFGRFTRRDEGGPPSTPVDTTAQSYLQSHESR